MESRAWVGVDGTARGAAPHLRWEDGVRLGRATDECDRTESGGSLRPDRLPGRGRRRRGLSLQSGTGKVRGQQCRFGATLRTGKTVVQGRKDSSVPRGGSVLIPAVHCSVVWFLPAALRVEAS